MTPQEAVEQLGQLDLRTTPITEIRKLYEIIADLPAIIATIPADVVITRVRMGRHLGQSELSYPPVSVCKKMQRSSLERESAFYASLSDDCKHLEHSRAIGLSECSLLAREGKKSRGREFLTVSQWINKKPLRVISFITDRTFALVENRSKFIETIAEAFKDGYNRYTDVQKEVIRIIDEDFCRMVVDGCNYEYKRTAILAHDMLYDSPYDLDGIIYAPVHMEGRFGINVMLKPTSVDEKLELYKVAYGSYYKNAEDSLMTIDKIYDSRRHLLKNIQIDEDEICRRIGVGSVKELPVVKYR